MSDTTAQAATERTARDAANRLLMDAARRGGPWVAVLALVSLAAAAAAVALPAVLGATVDALVADGAVGRWVAWSGVLVAVLVVTDAVDDLAAGAAVARSTAWLRNSAVRHVLAVGSRPDPRLSGGEVTVRIVGNASEACRVAPDLVRSSADMLPALGGIVALFLIDPWLCASFLVGMPIFLLALRVFARDASAIALRYLELQGTLAARLVDALGGARTIAAAGTAGRERRRVLAPLPDLHRQGVAMWRTQMRITAQDAVLVSLLELAVVAVAGVLLAQDRISAGQLLAASGYVLLASNVGSAVTAMNRLARSRAAAARVVEVLEQPPMIHGTALAPAGPGRLELRGVTARAGGRMIFEHVDLVVPAGRLVAIVGRSGAGKSLLAALVGGLEMPAEGQVLLDGVPLEELRHDELRREIGYGFERPVLIGETVADAIAFGGDEPSPEEVVSAARDARADDFVRRLPAGYATPVALAPMSGGEAQRIGLARTFAHARKVVVLDDVAASLDAVTEQQVGEVLTGTLAGRTRIVVAHRTATAARADLVVWLDGGRVRAVDVHAVLWRDPDYRALFDANGEHDEIAANGAQL